MDAIHLDRHWVLGQLPRRRPEVHKGTQGTLNILAGSRRYRGAALLCADGALRAGAGVVRLLAIEPVCAAAAARLPACILEPLHEHSLGGVAASGLAAMADLPGDAWLVGPGMGDTPDTAALVAGILGIEGGTAVVDADGLNALACNLSWLRGARRPVILTPHIGEMARLTGLSPQAVSADQIGVAASFASQYDCVVVLKSHVTAVASPGGGLYINDRAGNPGMAKGGSGDVLAGIVASLCAQGIAPAMAAPCGVWLHARAGDIARERHGEAGLSPADLPLCLGEVWRELGR